MIVRGTTPTHVFHIPFSIDNVVEAYITYQQNDRIVVDKRLEEISVDIYENTLSLQLTQDNTLGFSYNSKYVDNIVLIQIKLLFDNNVICVCRPIRDKVVDQIKDGKIYPVLPTAPLGDMVILEGHTNLNEMEG